MSIPRQDFRKFVQDKELGPVLSEIAESVKAANQTGADKWGLRISKRDLMLKVGFVEVLQAGDGWFHLLVRRDLVPKTLRADRRCVFSKESPYINAPGCISCDVKVSQASQVTGFCAPPTKPHLVSRPKAAVILRRSTIIPPEFVRFLTESLGVQLAQPSYYAANAATKRSTTAKPSAHQTTLHIVQAGIENGDKKWLEKAARNALKSPPWIVPSRPELVMTL